MAAKVNVKFVIILSAALLVVAGGVGVLGAMVLFRSAEDNIRRGDEYAAQGDYMEAAKSYAKAVNKEQFNVEYLRKWADAVRQCTPETDVEYRTMYFGSYLGALRQLAVVERTNPETQNEYLAALYRQHRLGNATADAWGSFIEQVNTSIENLDMAQKDAQRLLRYRGLASVFRIRTLESVDAAERARAADDLDKAYAADPSDLDVALAKVELISAEAAALFRAGRARESDARLTDAFEALERVDRNHPGSPRVRLQRMLLTLERSSRSNDRGDQAAVADSFRQGLSEVFDLASNAAGSSSSLDEQFVQQLARAAVLARSEELNQKWISLLDSFIALRPDHAAFRVERGKALAAIDRHEDAIAQFEQVVQMPDLPVSLEGLLLRQLRNEARRQQVESALVLWSRASGDEAKAQAMARVKGYRDDLARRVPADSAPVLRSDAQIAFAERRLDDAVSALARLRNTEGGDDVETLMMLGRALTAQRKIGAAAEQYERVFERDPNNVPALFALIDLEIQARNLDRVRELLAEAERLVPNDPTINRTRRLLQAQSSGVASDTDPVRALLNYSFHQRTKTPPDYAAAIREVEAAIPQFPDDPRIVLERVTLEAQTAGREPALALVKRYRERFPDNPQLAQLEITLAYENPLDARLHLINDSELSEGQKAIARAGAYLSFNQPEKADAEIARAKAELPDEPSVLELEFIRAIDGKNFTLAQSIAQRAAALNADGVQGQLFQARVELAQDKHDLAVATLDRVVRADEFNVPAWRMLGQAHLQLGRVDEALRAYNRALEIKPDDMPTVVANIAALTSVGRGPDALQLARRSSEMQTADASLLFARIDLEERFGDIRYAIDQRTRLRATNPEDRSNNLSLAQLFIRDGRLDEAQTLLDSARIDNGAPDMGFALIEARLLATRNRLDDAVARIEREIQRLPENRRGDGFVVLAEFLIERQRPEDAVEALERGRSAQGPLMPIDRRLGDYAFSVGDFEKAVESYRRVMDAKADRDGLVAKRLAEAHLRLGQLDSAERVIAAVESQYGADDQTIILRSQIALDRQNPLEARRLLDSAIERNPRNALAFIRRAQLGFTDDTQYAAVLRDLRQAVQLQPDNITVRQLLSQLFIRRNRVNEAIDELAQAVRSQPANDTLRLEYVRLLGQHGTPDQLIAAIQQAVSERGEAAPQWFTLAGDSIASAGDVNGAIRMYEQAHRVAQNPQSLARLVQAYLGARPPRLEQAAQALNGFNAATPDQQFMVALLRARVEAVAGNARPALQLLAQTWPHSGDHPAKTRIWFDQARAAFGSNMADFLAFVDQLPPQTPQGLNPAAKVILATIRSGDPAQAVSALQTLVGIEDETSDPETLLALARVRGQINYILGDYRAAADAYRQGLTLSPDDPELNNNLAYTLAKHLRQAQTALAYATKASEASPLDANILDTLGLIYLQLNRSAQADATFQRALDAARTDLERVPILAHLAQSKKLLNDQAGAMTFARRAVDLARTTPGADQLYSTEIEEAGNIAAGR